MAGRAKEIFRQLSFQKLKKAFPRFGSTIYGRVVFIIAVSLIVLFVAFYVVFRSVYGDFFDSTIKQTGDNVSSIVEGSLYYSMLENDKAMLQRTLDIISTMSGIDEVNMYDDKDSLAYTSLPADTHGGIDPNCRDCHDMAAMFPYKEKVYRIIGDTVNCGIMRDGEDSRQLLIRKPILNEKSCYTASCHYHSESDEVLGSLIIKLPLDKIDTVMSETSNNFLILVTLITGLMVSLLILFTRRRIKEPLKSIINASEAVSKGDTSIRLDIKPNLLDDMRKVSLAFNDMLDNIENASKELQNWSQQLEYKVQKKTEELSEAQNELIHVERIASLGKLSSSVAHEINNPLSGILVYSKLVQKQLKQPDFYHPKRDAILKHLKFIESETKRCGEIVKGLLDFSRKDQDNFEIKNLHEILEATCSLIRHSAKISNIKLEKDFRAEADTVYCNPNQIKQACFAILINAAEAIREDGEIWARTSNPDADTIRLDISDNGAGIAPEDLPHIFEPFYTTKRDSNGLGLGLAIVHGIIESHKGKI
ncbi:MAG: HAMP domain-containing protein, partial [Bacteroidales bacterium]|nr:HAMP domain-containing protein [Bacteroidales bacterium]